jgi:hypothetical protein
MLALHVLAGDCNTLPTRGCLCVLNFLFLREHRRELKGPFYLITMELPTWNLGFSHRVLLHQASLRIVGRQYGTCGRCFRIFQWSCVRVVMLGLLRASVLFILALISMPYVAATAARHRTTFDTNLAAAQFTARLTQNYIRDDKSGCSSALSGF